MVRNVVNSIRIVERISRSESVGVSEICRELSIPKRSAHNIRKTLVHERILAKNPQSSKYNLGARLVEYGSRAIQRLDICRTAHPSFLELNSATNETVHLTVLDNEEVLYLDCVESTVRIRTYSVIGERAPLHCTAVGKAIRAFLAPARQKQIITAGGLARFTDDTITDEEGLMEDLCKTVRRGYSIDNMEHEEFLRCVGAPIWD